MSISPWPQSLLVILPPPPVAGNQSPREVSCDSDFRPVAPGSIITTASDNASRIPVSSTILGNDIAPQVQTPDAPPCENAHPNAPIAHDFGLGSGVDGQASSALLQPQSVFALNTLYRTLNSPSQLNGWTANGGDPCTQSWRGITCSGSSVIKIKLSGLGLSGTLAYNMMILKSLVVLDMSNNNLGSGGQIPYNLPPNLTHLNLASNQFTQGIPYSISQMTSLEYVNIAHNRLQGSLPDMFWQLSKLKTMDLSFNSFTGDLPHSFNNLSSLTSLYLEDNQFTGSINVLVGLPLNVLNVGNNHFSGGIPEVLKKIKSLQTDGNPWNSGPTPQLPIMPPPGSKINPASNLPDVNDGNKRSRISDGALAGIIISVLIVGAIIAFFLLRRKMNFPFGGGDYSKQEKPPTSVASSELEETKAVQTSFTVHTTESAPDSLFSLILYPSDHHKYEDEEFNNNTTVDKAEKAPVKATLYSVAEVQVATNSFSADNLMGEGAVGRFYRAHFNDGKVLAIKKINSSCLPNKSPEDFIDVVSHVARLQHPNLVELVGYCCEHGQYMLVYEFQKNGSLYHLLHNSNEYERTLTWNTRIKIALGTARALEYLHEVCSPCIINRNFKSSHILLDEDLNPRLSDYGLSMLVPDVEFQAMNQNTCSGYIAPEVAMFGHYTKESDIYSFGVVMLELLTGQKPFDRTRPWSEQSLVRWATPQLHDIDALYKMVDPALNGLFSAKSLSRFADVIALCVQSEPEFRPPMSEVVHAVVRLIQRVNISKRLQGKEVHDIGAQDYMK